jgi:RHS repeat-associated protein
MGMCARVVGIISERIRELHRGAGKLPAGREAEVFFFRNIWPGFYSRLFYYLQLYLFELRRLSLPAAALRELIRQEEKKVSRFFRMNREFWMYFRSGAAVLDEQFTRAYSQARIFDPLALVIDQERATLGSYRAAWGMAMERYGGWLAGEGERVEHPAGFGPGEDYTLDPTDADFVEWLYLLQNVGAVKYKGEVADISRLQKWAKWALGKEVVNIYDLYSHDNQYQFTGATWGTSLNFSGTTTTYTATTLNKESVLNPSTGGTGYDYNGNILDLQRTDNNGNALATFAYSYNTNTNQLSSITNTSTGTAQTYGTYTYDAIGEMIGEATTGASQPPKYYRYNSAGQVTAVSRNSTFTEPVATFVYDEMGARIIKNIYNASNQLSQITYYVGGAVYTQNVTSGVTNIEYPIDGGGNRLGTYYRQSGEYVYEMRDHLGNVRAVVTTNGSSGTNVLMYNDYYPFGMVLRNANTYRYGYQGQYAEADPETGLNSFSLRMYDPTIGRWLTTDPNGQYSSPYTGMGNDPVDVTDPTGGEGTDFFQNRADGSIFWSYDNVQLKDSADFKYLGVSYTDPSEKEIEVGIQQPDGSLWFRPFPINGTMTAENTRLWDNYVTSYDLWATYNNKPSIATGTPMSPGMKTVGNPYTGFHHVLNDGPLETPIVDPIDLAAAGMGGIVKGLAEVTAEAGGGLTIEAIKDLYGSGNYLVCQGIDPLTQEVGYFGMTGRNFAIREAEHLASGTGRASLSYSVVPGAEGLSKLGARIYEQQLINSKGLPNLLNEINSISETYWFQYGIDPPK